MDIENKKSSNEDENEQMFDFFSQGGTFKDLKNMSEESMEAIYSVAYNLYKGGKYDESLKIFQFLCFYDHLNKKYFMGLGASQQMLKNYNGAIEIFTFVTVLDTEDPKPVIYLGDCYLAEGNNEKSMEYYVAAVKLAGEKDEYTQDKERAETMIENIK